MTSSDNAAIIAVDWGSTRLRIAAITATGVPVHSESAPRGILHLPREKLQDTLHEALGPFLRSWPGLPVVAAGMIGSRNGLIETRPVSVPATVETIAAGSISLTCGAITMSVSPGLIDHSADPADLIRGEEIQLLGQMTNDSVARVNLVILPGTHSKWVRLDHHQIVSFRTFLTGEIYERLLDSPAFASAERVSRTDADPDIAISPEFLHGVDLGASSPGLLHELFAVRGRMLQSDSSNPFSVPEYLSGLVLGAEIREALALGLIQPTDRAIVIADGPLGKRYRTALQARDLDAGLAPAGTFERGIAALYTAAQRRYEPSHEGV